MERRRGGGGRVGRKRGGWEVEKGVEGGINDKEREREGKGEKEEKGKELRRVGRG